MNKFRILVVDDESIMRSALVDTLAERGFELVGVSSGEEAITLLEKEDWHVVLSDLRMPGMNGLELLQRIKEIDSDIKVVLMTAFGTIENAVSAMKSGASDYITKPFSFDEIEIVLNRIHKETRMTRKIAVLETELKGIRSQSEFCNMIGKSEVMNKLYDLIDRIAASPATVLITGESGTGKELVANALHMKSPRNMGPLIKLNCAAMPETLLESELFGHEKGAFTNAYIKKTGHFELADGGTIFLDEIGEIPISTQAKLLRVLQEKTFTRVGGMKPVSVDVRIIAATNQNLEEAVKKGQFRQDLFFRLNVLPLKLPPLRERKGDVRLLARHFLSLFGQQNNRDFQDFENSALEKLIDYNWPGNVRELMNVIERLVVLNDGKLVTDEMLPLELSDQSFGIMEGDLPSPTAQMKEVEAWHIKRVVENVDHNLSRAARTLGIDRKTLYNKIERYGLTVIDND